VNRGPKRIGGTPNSGLRELIVKHRAVKAGPKSPFHLPGVDGITEKMQQGYPVIISSSFLWSVLQTAGLPNDDYGRSDALDGKYWLVDERDGFEEWTDPHPDAPPADAPHCGGGRTCYQCDPEHTGSQTVRVERTVRPVDFCPVEWEPPELAPGRRPARLAGRSRRRRNGSGEVMERHGNL
jgi:hypothetical protein